MQFVSTGKTKFAMAFIAACLVFAGSAKAAPFTGGFGFLPAFVNTDGTASFDASDLTMNGLDAVSYNNGSFAGEQLAIISLSTATISNLTAAPTPVNVPAFITFAYPSQAPYGTAPGNGGEYVFNLLTLSDSDVSGFGDFLGTGNLVDTSNVLDTTPAIMTISFTQTGNNYTGTVTPVVPEPATTGLAAAGLLGALARRRRKA
jgi:PEP-CTERM motif